MTRTRSNVVPFERPASYWVVKARRHAAPAQLPDAARMMRKALEKSGDSHLALELSQIYARMHCYTASERYLMRACAREGLTGTVAFLTGCAALNRGEEDLGERAIDLSLRLEPDGPFAEQAQDILEIYPWRQTPFRPRCARGEELCYQSRVALSMGRRKDALRLAEKAWNRAHTPDIALQLGVLLPPERGMIYLTYAAQKQSAALRPWLCLAAACYQAGKTEQAKTALEQAQKRCETITDAEIFCQTAWQTGQTALALSFVQEKLQKMPASTDYLRLKYLCLLRLRENGAAMRTLDMLLDIDPDDVSALRYRLNPHQSAIDPERRMLLSVLGSIVSSAPERLKRGRLNRVLHLLVMTLDGLLTPHVIYRLLPPLWKKLTNAEKWACDDRRTSFYPLAFSVYLLLLSGQAAQAKQFFENAPGKKRILRFLTRALRLNAAQNLPHDQA